MSEERQPLDRLQDWMQRALVFPREISAEETERIVEASPRLSGAERLAIYQRSYCLRILRCMREQFPALAHALGEELFTDFAREYLEACPPESYTLYDLGRRFPGWLEETRPDREAADAEREGWVDFMVDLARFERRLFVMFDEPGHEGRPFADERVPDGRLRLQPCLALGDYRFPVAWYYHEVRAGNDPPFPPRQQSLVALVRKDYLTHTYPLAEPHYRFLKAMADGGSVQEALEAVAADVGRPIEEVRRSWAAPDGKRRAWLEAGFFIEAR